VPNQLRALQPKQTKNFAAGEVFQGALSEDVVLIPNQPGDYTLEPVRFVYFDPAAEQYRTLEARPPVLHITGAPIAAPPAAVPQPASGRTSTAANAAPAVASSASSPAAPAEGSAPALLPRDPMGGTASGLAPFPAHQLTMLIGAPVAALALYWLALAIRQVRLSDPRRPQRQALRHLRAAIDRVASAASADERIAALLAWQRTAALALGIDLAAPTAAQLTDPQWTDLWAGSERALYGREHTLPAGWCECARMLCARPRFNPLRGLSIGQPLPKAAAAALLLALATVPAKASDSSPEGRRAVGTGAAAVVGEIDPSPPRRGGDGAPPSRGRLGGEEGALDAYAQGDFAHAHEQFLARVTEAPSDWIARYNLGLAEAQQGDHGRALGETMAAFVQAPGNADVRWNARAFAAHVPGFDRDAAALLAGGPLTALAGPATWQALAVIAALLGCTGAALVLRRRYAGARGFGWAAPALVGFAIALGGLAAFSLHTYGRLADPRCALVAGAPVLRSVPTEAEAEQQQKPLPAGTLVLVEQDFLGWVKVALRGGETGWLRHGDLVPLYAAPSA